MTRCGTVAALGIVAGTTACESPPRRALFPIEVRALTDTDDPVPGVAVAAERVLGITGRDGTWTGAREGRDGERLRLQLTPPAGFRPLSSTSIDGSLQVASRLGAAAPEPQPVRAVLRLAPRERRYAVLVRAEAWPHCTITIDGRPRGRTDAFGAAVLVHAARPGTTAVVVVEGPPATLRPASRHAFVLPDGDEILLVDVPDPARRTPRGRRIRPRGRSRSGR